jgi:hypothetical protein
MEIENLWGRHHNIDSPLNRIAFVIPAKAGIQQKNISRSEQTVGFVLLRVEYSINWIPAFAGMTCCIIRVESIV